jgi:hypothetical protein
MGLFYASETISSPTHFRMQPLPPQPLRPVLQPCRSVLTPEERQRGLDELRCCVEEDGAVTAIGHDPKRGARNAAIHVKKQLSVDSCRLSVKTPRQTRAVSSDEISALAKRELERAAGGRPVSAPVMRECALGALT